jgi:hypothetical protein
MQNIGDADRTMRGLIGAVLAIVFFNLSSGMASAVVGGVAVILLTGTVTGWSLLYTVLRMSTRSERDANPVERS